MSLKTSPARTILNEIQGNILKWKSHEMTKANIMHASRKFMMRRPCQNLWVSERTTGALDTPTVATVALLASLACPPITFTATAPQISQTLDHRRANKDKWSRIWRTAYSLVWDCRRFHIIMLAYR